METKQHINNFFLKMKKTFNDAVEGKTVLICALLSIIYLISGYFKWLEILVSVCALTFMCILPLQKSFCVFMFLHCFTMSNIGYDSCFMVTLIGYTLILLVKYIIGLKKGIYKQHNKVMNVILIFLTISTALSLFKSIYPGAWLYYVYFTIIYLFVAMKKEFDIKQGMNYMFGGLLTSCGLALFGLILPLFQYKIMYGGNRFSAYINNPNYLYMRALFVLSYYMFRYAGNKISHLKFGLIYVLCAIIALSTLSKTSIVMLGLITFIFIIFYLKQDFKVRIKFVGVFIGLILIIGLICFKFVQSLLDRFIEAFKGENFMNSLLTGRDEIWSLYLDAILKNPFTLLFGNGLLTKQVFVANQYGPTETHSFYLFLLYRFGILGTLAFGFVVFTIIRELKYKKPKLIATLPLIFILIESLFDNTFKCYNFTYFIFAIMILFVDQKDKQISEEQSNSTTNNNIQQNN